MPTLIDLGETWSSPTYVVRDANDTPVAGATVTATVTVGGSTTSTTISGTGTGTYAIDYLTAAEGTHDFVVTATGGPLGSIVRKWTDTIEVVAPGASIVSADDALAHLRAAGVISGAADMDHLRWLCLVASRAVARDLGRAVGRETVTAEPHSGGAGWLRLRRTPVQSVTTVVEDGVTLASTDYTLDDAEGGLLWRGGPSEAKSWAWGRRNVTVTYVAGMTTVDAVLRYVALTVVERLWQTTQQAAHDLVGDVEADAAVFAAVAGQLTGPQQDAYDSFRAAGLA